MTDVTNSIADLMLDTGSFEYRPSNPVEWASGNLMPVYNDNRRLLSTPVARELICKGFQEILERRGIEQNTCVAGVATGGIAPATSLADRLGSPLLIVRPEKKNHGLGKAVEGSVGPPGTGEEDTPVILVEDLVSTGGSSVRAAQNLVATGMPPALGLAVFTYGFAQDEAFDSVWPGFTMEALVTVDDLIERADSRGLFTKDQVHGLREWLADPFGWQHSNPAVASPGQTPAAAPHSAEATYQERLSRSRSDSGTALCIGIDPVPEFVPDEFTGTDCQRIAAYYSSVFELVAARSLIPSAIKPNIGFFSSLDRPMEGRFDGSGALAEILQLVRKEFPGVPVILDAKRGDIARSSANYATEAFRTWGVDAVTASPYMGHDSIGAIIDGAATAGGLVYSLCLTSNPGATQFQELDLGQEQLLFENVAGAIVEWHKTSGCCGAVVGATHPRQRDVLLERFGAAGVPVLVPGVGSQGGQPKEVMNAAASAGYPSELLLVNVSSAITHPWKNNGAPSNWKAAVGDSLAFYHGELA